MSETIEPPIPLPPAQPPVEPPAGLPPVPPPPAQTDKTRTQTGAVITIISGAVGVVAVFLPAFSLFDGVSYQYWPMTNTPDAMYFMPVGLVVAILGAIRLHNDHIAVRVITVLIALYTAQVAATDANNLSNVFTTRFGNSGYTFTYGPALLMFGVASVAAIVGACLTSAKSR